MTTRTTAVGWRGLEREILAAYRNGSPLKRICSKYCIAHRQLAALLDEFGMASRADIRQARNGPEDRGLVEHLQLALLDLRVDQVAYHADLLAALMA